MFDLLKRNLEKYFAAILAVSFYFILLPTSDVIEQKTFIEPLAAEVGFIAESDNDNPIDLDLLLTEHKLKSIDHQPDKKPTSLYASPYNSILIQTASIRAPPYSLLHS